MLAHCGGSDLTLPGPPELTVIPTDITIVKGDAQTVVAAASPVPQTVSSFDIGVMPGGVNETEQVLTFEVIGNSAPCLFASGPTITRDGQGHTATVTFTPAGFPGASAVTIVLRDNGGTEHIGYDTSSPQTFTIVVQ